MEKRELWRGIGMILAGLLCLGGALAAEAPLGSLLCGFAGGLGVPGIQQVLKYVKWSRPENQAAYRDKRERERIELRDERKEMLRDKAGRYAYCLGLLACAGAAVVFSVLGALEERAAYRPLVLFLGVYLLFQYLAGLAAYRILERKY